ncbi:MAG: glucose-6-phosphate dehydrogenase, partial [Bacteroidota bacterium]|nr:glucose-6-phosphate dehydrogenase [Bacteroidota bacterium]
IIGVHHEAMEEIDFKTHLLEGINTFSRSGKAKKQEWEKFSKHIHYFQGDFTQDDTYIRLGETLDTNDKQWKQKAVRLFYYAIAPRFIETISVALAVHQLAIDTKLHRIIVEKPFGTDLPSAKALNQLLAKYFKERQIYRIDHYLGKETVQNIMAFRFANIVFEPIWNHHYIEHVQITVAEDIGIGNRGSYYEGAGALKDMIQNHLLQLLCVAAMEPPVSFSAEEVRNKKADVLHAIREFSKKDIEQNIIRGQYGEGIIQNRKQKAYRSEKNVDPKSNTETFIALKLFIDNWRWQKVPFYLRTGKCLKRSTSIIVIQFKSLPLNLIPSTTGDGLQANQLVISIQPEMEISLLFHAKQPGLELKITPVEMDFTYTDAYDQQVPEAYETLLLDALQGDATLFMRADQVEAAWLIVTPIINAWKIKKPGRFPNYAPGNWGPKAADALISRDGFKWMLLPEERMKIKK